MTRGELHRLMRKVDREKARHHEALVRRMETHLGALLNGAPPYVWLRSYWHGPSAVEWFPYGHLIGFFTGSDPKLPLALDTTQGGALRLNDLPLERLWEIEPTIFKIRGRVPPGPTPGPYDKPPPGGSPRYHYWRRRFEGGFKPNRRFCMEADSGRAAMLGVTCEELRRLVRMLTAKNLLDL